MENGKRYKTERGVGSSGSTTMRREPAGLTSATNNSRRMRLLFHF